MCVFMCRTARDAGVHLSEARVSLLGEQGFCLVNVLPGLMDPAADAGHGHLRVRGNVGRLRGRREEGIKGAVREA